MPSNLKVIHVRASDSLSSLLHHKASLSGLSLSQFLIEKGLSDGLSFDSQLRHFIQRIAFESFIIREELPNFAKSIHFLSKLLSSDSHLAGYAGDANLASYELKPPFNDLLKPYNPSLLNLANNVTANTPSTPSSPYNPSSSHNPSSSSTDLHQLLQQLSLLFDKLAFSTEFLISLFGNIKRYPDILRNLHLVCDRNPHLLSTSLNFDFSPSSTSNTSKTSNLSHSLYGSYSYLPNFAFLTSAPLNWAFSSASPLKLNSQAQAHNLGHSYNLSLIP